MIEENQGKVIINLKKYETGYGREIKECIFICNYICVVLFLERINIACYKKYVIFGHFAFFHVITTISCAKTEATFSYSQAIFRASFSSFGRFSRQGNKYNNLYHFVWCTILFGLVHVCYAN